MSRQIKKRGFVNSVAVIVDGKDEKWYLEKVKKHYPSDKLREVRLEPNLPQQKKVKDLFEMAREKAEQGYAKVLLFVDFDSILDAQDEMNSFRTLYHKWIEVNQNPTKKSNYSWMANLRIIVNNPCLEYWFLLHFKKTNKFYAKFEPGLKQELRKQPGMEKYEKAEDYYNKVPDIYQRLDKDGGLAKARRNAEPFSLELCHERSTSEIYKMFDFFDNEL